MTDSVSFKPTGFHTLTPYLAVHDAAAAIEFYKKAFNAEEVTRMDGPGGSVMHCELRFGDSMLMLGDEAPEMGSSSPKTIGDSPVGVMIYVEDVDAAFA